MQLFVNGRKTVFKEIAEQISEGDSIIWFHCASLGEFEQGRPIIERVKKDFPKYKILLTFFSPSGYEVQKNYKGADIVSYLPLDTKKNAQKFIEIVQPKMAIFVKYEFWPNFLKALKKQEITTIVVSAIFRKEQAFFKLFGSWMRKSLQTFNHFFVQDKNSETLLHSIHFDNVTVSGDTRFDRVAQIKKQDTTLEAIATFTNKQATLVAGSTWQEDENALVFYINNKATAEEKFIIVPHAIDAKSIVALQKSIQKKTVLYSERTIVDLQEAQVFIIDTVGILSKIYAYATIVYVGGGYTKTGVHNVLEPAVFGVPLLIGPNFSKFKEVKDLVTLKAITVTSNKEELTTALTNLFNNKKARKEQGEKAAKYVEKQEGATKKIVAYIQKTIKE